jgi:hypothetical protein
VGVLNTGENSQRFLSFNGAVSAVMATIAVAQAGGPGPLFGSGARVGGLLDNPIYMGACQMCNTFLLAVLVMKARKGGPAKRSGCSERHAIRTLPWATCTGNMAW